MIESKVYSVVHLPLSYLVVGQSWDLVLRTEYTERQLCEVLCTSVAGVTLPGREVEEL
jgi:hypothetical protein